MGQASASLLRASDQPEKVTRDNFRKPTFVSEGSPENLDPKPACRTADYTKCWVGIISEFVRQSYLIKTPGVQHRVAQKDIATEITITPQVSMEEFETVCGTSTTGIRSEKTILIRNLMFRVTNVSPSPNSTYTNKFKYNNAEHHKGYNVVALAIPLTIEGSIHSYNLPFSAVVYIRDALMTKDSLLKLIKQRTDLKTAEEKESIINSPSRGGVRLASPAAWYLPISNWDTSSNPEDNIPQEGRVLDPESISDVPVDLASESPVAAGSGGLAQPSGISSSLEDDCDLSSCAPYVVWSYQCSKVQSCLSVEPPSIFDGVEGENGRGTSWARLLDPKSLIVFIKKRNFPRPTVQNTTQDRSYYWDYLSAMSDNHQSCYSNKFETQHIMNNCEIPLDYLYSRLKLFEFESGISYPGIHSLEDEKLHGTQIHKSALSAAITFLLDYEFFLKTDKMVELFFDWTRKKNLEEQKAKGSANGLRPSEDNGGKAFVVGYLGADNEFRVLNKDGKREPISTSRPKTEDPGFPEIPVYAVPKAFCEELRSRLWNEIFNELDFLDFGNMRVEISVPEREELEFLEAFKRQVMATERNARVLHGTDATDFFETCADDSKVRFVSKRTVGLSPFSVVLTTKYLEVLESVKI